VRLGGTDEELLASVRSSGFARRLVIGKDRQRYQPEVSRNVELSIIGLNFLYAIGGVIVMWVAYRMIDRLTPEVDFPDELRKGNVAVAIVIAAIFISIALIIGRALN